MVLVQAVTPVLNQVDILISGSAVVNACWASSAATTQTGSLPIALAITAVVHGLVVGSRSVAMQATLARLPLRKISMNPLGRALACTGNFRNLVDTWNLAAETEGYSDNRSSVMRTARSTHFRRVLLGHNGHLSHKRQRHQTRDGSAHHLRRFPDSWEFSSDIRGPAQLPGAPGGCQAVNWPPSRCVHCAHFGLRFGSYVWAHRIMERRHPCSG